MSYPSVIAQLPAHTLPDTKTNVPGEEFKNCFSHETKLQNLSITFFYSPPSQHGCNITPKYSLSFPISHIGVVAPSGIKQTSGKDPYVHRLLLTS